MDVKEFANRFVGSGERRRTLARVSAKVAACAVAGSLLTDPGSSWYRELRKPSWQPPPAAFPIVWTTLYAAIAAASAAAISELGDADPEEASDFERALEVNLLLNAAWSGLFFRLQRPAVATAGAAALAVSSVDLARRGAASGPAEGLTLGAYAVWCGFATALSAAIQRLNRRG